MIKQLREMEREDVIAVLSNSAPLYHLISTNQSIDQNLSEILSADLSGPTISPAQRETSPEIPCSSSQPSNLRNDFDAPNRKQQFGKSNASVTLTSTTGLRREGSAESSLCTRNLSSSVKSSRSSSKELFSDNKDYIPNHFCPEFLFTADDSSPTANSTQHSPGGTTADRTIASDLFTLDESLPSPTGYSSIPLTGPSKSSSSVILSPIKVGDEDRKFSEGTSVTLVSAGTPGSPDLTSSCITTADGKISYALPDVASDTSMSRSNSTGDKKTTTTSFTGSSVSPDRQCSASK